MTLGVVTATVNRARAAPCLESWRLHATEPFPLVIVDNGGAEPYLGPVAAFRVGVEQLLREHPACDVVACFHDDLVILDRWWDQAVLACFRDHPRVGLASFDGATALGDDALYHTPYNPDQLARRPVATPQPQPIVAPADFCVIGRRAFWSGFHEAEWRTKQSRRKVYPRPWAIVDDLAIIDHFYDAALGCLARRGGWQVWYLPVRTRHLGGQTTVHDPGYVHWADEEIEGGDRGFWEAAHRIGYDTFKDVLPLRLPEGDDAGDA